jgi:hypothetical protein
MDECLPDGKKKKKKRTRTRKRKRDIVTSITGQMLDIDDQLYSLI